MGMTKEIEQVFQHVIENDLARISRSAVPTYHWTTSAPCSMCHFSSPTTGNSVTLTGQDYQIVRIELDPLEVNAKTRMPKIRDRRAFRKVNSEFETLVDEGETENSDISFDKAYHEYFEETGPQGPVQIVPRLIDETTVDDELPLIISVAGVDYVRKDIVENQQEYESRDIINIIQKPPRADVDLWPEEVVLRHPTRPDDSAVSPVVYIRFDVEYWEDGCQKNNRLDS